MLSYVRTEMTLVLALFSLLAYTAAAEKLIVKGENEHQGKAL